MFRLDFGRIRGMQLRIGELIPGNTVGNSFCSFLVTKSREKDQDWN